MNRTTFLLEDKIQEIKKSFIKDGWLKIYESNRDNEDDKNQVLIFCCLVEPKRLKEYKQSTNWEISPGCEGKPSIFSSHKNGKPISWYQTYSEKGIEPFIFSKDFNFSDGYDSYFDISEEFVLYFKLYEKGKSKQERSFYFIDEVGDLEEVISIKPNIIRVKLKYLKEYIAIRKIHFAICFDFMRLSTINLGSENIKLIDENFESENYFYNHLIRPLGFAEDNQSRVHGKIIINYDKNIKSHYLRYQDDEENEKFIIGYDSEGNEELIDCKRTNENYFKLTYFKKEVLNKYYNDPNKYKVNGWRVSSYFFSLKIDNNNNDYVAVFIVELSSLPRKEQLHWKQYNIPPQNGISNTYYQTMILGNWVEHPETPDLYFKDKYEKFNKDWEEKFGWKFYKSLAKEDEHIFTSLHLLTSNNVKTFSEQVLSIIKLTIDRLNEEELKKVITDKSAKGISKLELFLEFHNIEMPDMIIFLRNLWDLRSGLLAHSFSNSNTKCKSAIEFFGIKENNYVEVAKEIFIKSVYTLNSLERQFL